MRLSILSLGLACLLAAPPSPASVRHRAAAHRTADGGATRVHGTQASGPEGHRAWHAGATARDGQGHLSHARASGVAIVWFPAITFIVASPAAAFSSIPPLPASV